MHTVIVGSGYTGSRVAACLPADTVSIITRSQPTLGDVDIQLRDFDSNEAEPIRLPDPCAVLYTVPPPTHGDDDPRLAGFLSRIDPAPARLVYLSTSGVYGDRGGNTVTEADAPTPLTPRARRRVAAESLLTDWCDAHGTALCVLRVPGIYGPGRLGLDRLRDSGEVLRDEESGPGNRIHVDDLTGCCIAALGGAAPGGIYNVGDGDYRSTTGFSRLLAQLAGLPEPQSISLAEAETRWSAMRLSFVRESRRVDVSRMHEVLGYTPRYADPADGIRASLADEADAEN